jgi:hypothetical protein
MEMMVWGRGIGRGSPYKAYQEVGTITVKSRLTRYSSLQNNDQQEQAQVSDLWSPVNVQGDSTPPSPTGIPPLVPPPTGRKGGLLSSGKYTNKPQQQQIATSTSVASEAPFQHYGAEPATGPLFPPAQQPAPMSAHMPGMQEPVSPHQSGMTPLASLYASPPIQQSPVSQPSPALSRTAQPISEPLGSPWQPMLAGFRNIPPPMMQPPLPINVAPPGRIRKKSFPIWARIAVAVFIVLAILIGSGVGYYQINFASHLSNITGQQAANVTIKDKDGSIQSSANAGSIGTNRINILLLGSDNDAKFDAPLAQTDIIVTIDPQTKYVGMLSIPRDLWINVPGFGMHKLDEAFGYGWQYVHQGPTPLSNAAGLSILTIEQDFGIHIDHYAWVGLDGFIKVIDTAGGVDINVLHPMLDDVYPNDINTANVDSYKRL